MSNLQILRDIEQKQEAIYHEKRSTMSFDEWFALFVNKPKPQLRSAAQYVRDAILYFGQESVPYPEGPMRRFRIFDRPWDKKKGRIVAQERVQNELFTMIDNFVHERRVRRFVLLHGPNGSAKTSLLECLADGVEQYSQTEEGASYCFNWIFPKSKVNKKTLGFSQGSEAPTHSESYAHLDDIDIDGRLPADLKDHPLLLIKPEDRQEIFQSLQESGALPTDSIIEDYFLEGDLSPRSRAIFDALLDAYHGDWNRVLQHIQVTRFTYSSRYRRGIVTVEPQLHVDASIRQVTADRTMQSLPPSLSYLSLYEPMGDLVEANRGFIHYNDLLKKPIDSFKYLLATCEKGTVALPNAILHLDCLFLASSNEALLNAFKEYPDFSSFKGRMDLIRMPYLRNYLSEQCIYDDHLEESGLKQKGLIVPHASFVLALWAVLSRMEKPNPAIYPKELQKHIDALSPMEKADLYASGQAPKALSNQDARELRALLPELLDENQDHVLAEGLFGASPREMKQLLLDAHQDKRFFGISPLGILEGLREHCKQKSVYAYLQRKPDGAYHQHEKFIDEVKDRWIDRVNEELRQAMGLVDGQRYEELFSKYLLHATYKQKNERLYNERTKSYESPDEHFMGELEKSWQLTGSPLELRRDLISRVGAWRVEHPDSPIPYRQLFPKLIGQLEQDYYTQQGLKIQRQLEHCLSLLTEESGSHAGDERGATESSSLSQSELDTARAVLLALEKDYGYPRASLHEVLRTVLRERY